MPRYIRVDMDDDIRTRQVSSRDVPALKELWGTVFGDGLEDIDRFFDHYFDPGLTVAAGGAVPRAAAYILPIGRLVLRDGKPVRCAMLYAIATAPEFRGRGLGEAVTRAAAVRAKEAGFPAVVLCPASDSLFDFYAERCGFREFFAVWEARLDRTRLPAPSAPAGLAAVTPAEYGRIRRALLAGTTYIDVDERGLRYQEALCAESGGGLFAVISGGGEKGCAIVERTPDGEVAVKELLLSDGCTAVEALSAVAARIPGDTFIVRAGSGVPISGQGHVRRFGMLLPADGLPAPAGKDVLNWYGPAFD